MDFTDNNDVLDLVDRLRSQGINHYIDLPQIIVCGDQSSGKSSVLEAISGLQFPRKDNLCTRFATEVILRRSKSANTNAAIVPADDRPEADRQRLSDFHRTDFQPDKLESLVEEARDAMGIDGSTRAFSKDVLRIELSAPQQPHLRLVDLPGLFSAGNKAQSEGDAKAVKALVLSYMRNPRSIILAVVSAKNDFANQIVTKYTRDVDEEGTRTLGIITKPDTLHPGSDSESSYLVLAKNQDVRFRLGWHVVRNRDFDTRMVSPEERDEMERDFFAQGVWTQLMKSQVGIEALRPRLSHLLRQQILVELPNLLADVQEGLEQCNKNLSFMGSARVTLEEQRLYLLRLSQEFTFLICSAIDGSYTDSFFGNAASGEGYRKRLRAVVQNKSISFASLMREQGHAKHIVDTVTKIQSRKDTHFISRADYVDKVLSLMTRSRGTELPGTYSPHIVSDLFSEQSAPWETLVQNFIDDIWNSTQATVKLIVDHVADTTTATSLQQKILQPALEKLKKDLDEAVGVVQEQTTKRHPITYNHYLTENIQKLRGERQRAMLSRKLDQFFGTDLASGRTWCENKALDVRSLLETLTQNTIADMDRYACSEAVDVMRAYYKVALKQYIDDVAHAIERTLLTQLSLLLSPQIVMILDDTMVESIAAESDDAQQERARIVRKHEALTAARDTLRGLSLTSMTTELKFQSLQASDDDENNSHLEESENEFFGRESRLVSAPDYDDAIGSPEPKIDSDFVAAGQAVTNDDWTVPIRWLGPVSAAALAKPVKRTKKKHKMSSNDQEAPVEFKWEV